MSPTYEQFREAVLNAASPEHKAEILIVECNCGGWKYKKQTECEKCGGNNGFVARNITLEDVLRVLGDKLDEVCSYKCEKMGEYLCWGNEDGELFRWLLTKPAHQQSDETLLSIIKLLE